ncbi:MAG: glycosyltransferase family 9 protein [Rhodospirillaceae bacterium]|nr:glycosyltransferase family 9 protein [Rhodospirillaceae bacterium]
MKILFVTATRIGDAVLSTGLLGHLADIHPRARFTIACGAPTASLFAAFPAADRIIPVTKRAGGLHWLKLWAETAGTSWDIVVDLRGSALAWLLRAGARHVLRGRDDSLHRVEWLARALNLASPPAPRLWTNAAQREAAAALVPAPPVLALAPTANWRGKRWRAENFVALAGRLAAPGGILPGARIAVFGGPGEAAMAGAVIENLPEDRVIDLVGKLDLPLAAACLARCAFFVGNDSGLMHMAAAAGIPTLGLFGPSRAEHYAPWGRRAGVARTALPYEALVGGPGYDHRSADSLMDSLSVDEAERAAVELWGRAA